MTGETGTKKIPIGISDFKDVIIGNYLYIDKTLFIKEILDKGDKILLLPRPRRFGKTLNLSMLKYFYDCCPARQAQGAPEPPPGNERETVGNTYNQLFASLGIMEAGSNYLEKMGNHPVIFLSFKDIKELDWETSYGKIKKLIRKEYSRHYYLLNFPQLLPFEREYFQTIMDLKGDRGDYEISLESLLVFLSRYYGKRAVILIDEYDAPVHAGFNYGYYEQVINFMRNFLSGGLKDADRYLEKGVLTGIMRIAKESIFSGLNNLGVYTLLSEVFNDKFGFTEEEVETLLKDFGRSHMLHQVRAWYNGYRFGSRIVYNPWSIVNYLENDETDLEPYWIDTSDNQIVDTLLSKGGKELKEELEQLLRGESIEKVIEKNISLKDVAVDEDYLWSFLLMGGYLKQTGKRREPASEQIHYGLAIPNLEVRSTYKRIVKRYFTTKIENKTIESMLKALVDGDVPLFEKMLSKVVLAVFSYHDFGDEPEKVYHALVAGLLTWISGTHEIKSNRESGYGRYDIMIIPRDVKQTGYVIEFKRVALEDGETIPAAIEAALQQIEEKKYETELIDKGIQNRKKLAIVFKGKEVHVKEHINEHISKK